MAGRQMIRNLRTAQKELTKVIRDIQRDAVADAQTNVDAAYTLLGTVRTQVDATVTSFVEQDNTYL